MDPNKVLRDTILATQDAIHLLREWQAQLEQWLTTGRAEPDDFVAACQELQEAHLWAWANEAGGHSLRALRQAVGVADEAFEPIGWEK